MGAAFSRQVVVADAHEYAAVEVPAARGGVGGDRALGAVADTAHLGVHAEGVQRRAHRLGPRQAEPVVVGGGAVGVGVALAHHGAGPAQLTGHFADDLGRGGCQLPAVEVEQHVRQQEAQRRVDHGAVAGRQRAEPERPDVPDQLHGQAAERPAQQRAAAGIQNHGHDRVHVAAVSRPGDAFTDLSAVVEGEHPAAPDRAGVQVAAHL